MNPIDQVFQRLRGQNKKAFMPFITAGDPNLEGTAALVQELSRAGSSLIEVGFPYSDPIADGPVIQASYTRALASGLSLDAIFSSFRAAKENRDQSVPLVAMISYALVLRRGLGRFIADAQQAGFSGAIVPDLPLEESAELSALCRDKDFKLVMLITPTTTPERAQQIAAASTGFIYFVSVKGVTGERGALPPALFTQLAALRRATDVPVCVGFGISKPEQVQALREAADGIIVGSALVRPLEAAGRRPFDQIVAEIGQVARGLANAL